MTFFEDGGLEGLKGVEAPGVGRSVGDEGLAGEVSYASFALVVSDERFVLLPRDGCGSGAAALHGYSGIDGC